MENIVQNTITLPSLESFTPVYSKYQNYRVGSAPDLLVFMTHLIPSSPVLVVFFFRSLNTDQGTTSARAGSGAIGLLGLW